MGKLRRYVLLCFGVIAMILFPPLHARADSSSDYSYSNNSDGTVDIIGYYGTDTKVKIPPYLFGKKVVGISSSAFMDNTSITQVAIPEGVTYIGDAAFCGCTNLVEVAIPDSVQTIGNEAFCDCSRLGRIDLPYGLKTLDEEVLSGCSKLTSIEIPETVTTIGWRAFAGCSNLRSINIPASVSQISNVAFMNCEWLEDITVDSANKYYDSRNNCKAIIETSTNKLVLGGCDTVIPYSVTGIGPHAFHGQIRMQKLIIPGSVTRVEELAFAGCSNLYKLIVRGEGTAFDESAIRKSDIQRILVRENSKALEYARDNNINYDFINNLGDLSHVTLKNVNRTMRYTGTYITQPDMQVLYDGTSLKENQDYTVEYVNNWRVGTAQIRITGIDEYVNGIIYNFSIVRPDFNSSSGNVVISGIESSVTYTGQYITQPGLSVMFEGSQLIEGQDYRLEYSNNRDIGVASVKVIGIGTCTGSQTISYSIVAISLADGDHVIVDGIEKSMKYAGSPVIQSKLEVRYNGQLLQQGIDYTVEYSDNNKVGRACVSIVGIGNYRDVLNYYYDIVSGTVDISSSTANVVIAGVTSSVGYKGRAITFSKLSITVDGDILKKNSDYSIDYSNNINVGTAKITIIGKDSYTGKITKTFTIKPMDISLKSSQVTVSGLPSSAIYSGKPYTYPKTVVKASGKTLTLNKDYKLTYTGNTNVGTAKVTITGIGNYTGKVTRTFAIRIPVGRVYTAGNLTYKVTKSQTNGTGTVVLMGTTNKKTTKTFTVLNVADSVVIGGVRFRIDGIYDGAFRSYPYLKKVVIGANVRSIGNNTFYGCTALTSLTIGKNVRIIGQKAFSRCKKLASVVVNSTYLTTTSMRSGAFSGIYSKAVIKVPVSKLSAYKNLFRLRGVAKTARIIKNKR